MYWQRGNSAVRTRKTNDKLNRSDYLTEDEQVKYPPIKRLDSFDHENSDFSIIQLDQKNARRLKTKSVYQSPSVKGRNFLPSNQYLSEQKTLPKDYEQATSKPTQNGTTVPFSDVVQLKKRILSLEIQNETLEQISDLLKHKNDTMESELNHLRKTIINPDKNDDLQRELLLRESEDKRYALQQQMKQMNKQYETSIQNLIEEKSILNRENKLLRKEMGQKQGMDVEPSSKRIAELVNLVDDLKVILNKKNEEQEKLQYKIEMMEQERGVRLQLDENDDYKRPSAVLNSYRDQQNLKDGKVSNNEAELNQKVRDYEETILRKNRDIERNEDKVKRLQQVINESYGTIRQYYKDVILDTDAHKSIDNRIVKAQQMQDNDNLQLIEVLKELLMRREGLEVTMKQEIQTTNQKMRVLEDEISKQDEMTKQDLLKFKNEVRTAKDKLKELSVTNAQYEQSLNHERQEKHKLLRDYETQKNEFMKKIKDLNTEINQIVNSTENEINKMKIENYQNQEQNKQLLQLISNKEREIAQLRYKHVQTEEEMQRMRKKTLEVASSTITMPAIRGGQGRSSSGFDKVLVGSSTPSSGLKAKLSPNNQQSSINNSTLSNFKNGNNSTILPQTPGSKAMGSQIMQPVNDGNNPFMKIKYIRSLKEWAVYWKYYQENISYRIQLLEKLMQTDSLRENFTQSEELKPKVFREALEVNNVQLYELTTLLMADTIDLDRLTKEEIRMIQNGHIIVKNLRPPRIDEDIQDYHNLHMSALKVLSYMDNSNMDWTESMSDELMNVNGLKTLVQYIKQDAKEWPKLLSLNVLHMMARKKALINFMVSYDIAQPLLDNLDNINGEIQRATLALLVPLLPEEQFINSIKDIKQLLKLSQLIMSDNNSILSNSLQCMSLIIPTFSYQKMLYKTDIIERIASVAGTSPYPTTRIHSLNLFKKLIDHSNEKECEMLNVQGTGLILRNLEMAEGETLKEMTPLRDVLYKSLKIVRSLIEDFPCPDEHLLCQRIMRLFCDVRLKNDNKTEQLVLEIIHVLWDKMESVMINHLHDRDVLKAIVEGYLRSTNLTDGINYGLMLVGICEKETMNGYIVDLKGRELIMKVIQNCHHMDYKTAITSAKILLFLVQEPRTYEYIDAGDLNGIAKLLKKEETQEEFISHSLDIIFYTMKNPKGLRSLIDFEIVESIFQIMDESLYSVNIMVKCFQSLELVHTLYTERDILKEMCIDDESTGPDILNGLSNMCLVKIQKDLGMSSLFFWRFLAKQSAANDMIAVVYHRADEFIQTLVKLKKSYSSLVPELSSQISTILQNLSYKSAELRDIHHKYEQ